MRIEYTGRHAEIPEGVRMLAERKLGKLAKLLPGITDVHIVVASDKHRQIAEVSLHSPGLTLTAARESGDVGASLAMVIDKLAKQAERHVGKLRGRKRIAKQGASNPSLAGSRDAGVEPAARIIRSRRFVAKPMTADEAALGIGSGESSFVVFRDAATERIQVLYRRKDGNLGLIEPEG
jgi:putative sigma-54 modulation protein